jgi:hypothetical protein
MKNREFFVILIHRATSLGYFLLLSSHLLGNYIIYTLCYF